MKAKQKKRTIRKRSAIARDLRTQKYKMRVVPDKRMKEIEDRLKKLENYMMWGNPVGKEFW